MLAAISRFQRSKSNLLLILGRCPRLLHFAPLALGCISVKRTSFDLVYPLPSSHFPFLPLHCSFLRRINFRLFCHWQRLAKQKALDVIEEKILGVGTGEIQTVMIDYLRLFL